MELPILLIIAAFVLIYRRSPGENVYRAVSETVGGVYEKYAPYSFKTVREKAKQLGQEFTPRQYVSQIVMLAGFFGFVGYVYFHSVIWAVIYGGASIFFVPYLAYMRCQRIYSEFIFEQIQTYATNVIMEFNTTQSFVRSLEGVRDSGIIEDPVLSDIKMMIDMSYQNGTIDNSIEYFNQKYPYYLIKNLHQLFYQITTEGARDAGDSLENMSLDIDALVEGVYRDQMDRKEFHNRFLRFGFALFFLILALQFMLGFDKYLVLIRDILVHILLHICILVNTAFLIHGEKYYNDDVGAE